MKTAMQEFQNRIPDASQIKQYIFENDPDEKMLDEWLFEIIFKGVDWIEKEKKQIIDAKLDKDYSNRIEGAEQYYNETFKND